ncbi:hypothetical protein LJB42_001887 [Komagataella kurtzmanii]|nr:hypothetical protein LJB42_001887 [Komagataella kurtzmanii]
MNRNPLFTAYRDTDELIQLREWFFNQKEVDNRKRAIAKVKSLKTRRHVAHSLDMTSLLTGIILNDESGLVDSDTLILSYTMAVIKFVNGTLDSLQQASHAIPLHALARELDIPSYFVETRHAGSHEHLPSLQMLRMVGKNIMDWLWNHYWCEIRPVSEQLTLKDLEDFRPARDFDYINWAPEDFEELIRNELKTFKRIRKVDISNRRADRPDTTEYKKTVSSLINLQTQEPQLFLDVFQDEILSLHKTLTDSMLKGLLILSKPLIEELGLEFFHNLILRLSELLNSSHSDFVKQWIQNLLTCDFKSPGIFTTTSIDQIINILKRENLPHNIDLLKALKSSKDLENIQLSTNKLEKLINVMARFQLPSASAPAKRSIVDISKDIQYQRKKKRKPFKIPDDTIKTPIWSPIKDWYPTPFGVAP